MMGQNKEAQIRIISWVKRFLGSDVRAIYLFGSQASGDTHQASDIDLAVWLHEKPDPNSAYALKTELSAHFKSDVDLVDLARADSVSKAQIVSSSVLLYAENSSELAAFETRVFSEYALLNEERREIIQDFVSRR